VAVPGVDVDTEGFMAGLLFADDLFGGIGGEKRWE